VAGEGADGDDDEAGDRGEAGDGSRSAGDACAPGPKGDDEGDDGNPVPSPCRVAATRPDDSASPAANTTSAAARPDAHGNGSPQTGQRVIPGRGPEPPACASSISRAVRARTLSGFTYASIGATVFLPPSPVGARAATRVPIKFTAPGANPGDFRQIRGQTRGNGGKGGTGVPGSAGAGSLRNGESRRTPWLGFLVFTHCAYAVALRTIEGLQWR
jgi:hypothetical protein